ncbi:MAG: hypothetical protein IJH04_04585, partial [Eggerthellaceae bacterium]|nr:hypothetical protein [Eggerthellaceae bacterium]
PADRSQSHSGGGRPLSMGFDMFILVSRFRLSSRLGAAAAVDEIVVWVVETGLHALHAAACADNALVLHFHHPHRGLHIFFFHCSVGFICSEDDLYLRSLGVWEFLCVVTP